MTMEFDSPTSISTEKTDEEIAGLVQAGNIQLFGLLVDRYTAKLRRYGRKFIFDREDIEDLVQEVFIKAYINIKSFDLKRRFSPWLYRIAHNQFVNALKRKLSEKVFAFDLDLLLPHPVAQDTADGDLHRAELRQLLDRGLTHLKAKYREPLVLYYFEDLDYREIAEILKIPVSTVGIRLRRGRALLQIIIKKIDSTYGQ